MPHLNPAGQFLMRFLAMFDRADIARAKAIVAAGFDMEGSAGRLKLAPGSLKNWVSSVYARLRQHAGGTWALPPGARRVTWRNGRRVRSPGPDYWQGQRRFTTPEEWDRADGSDDKPLSKW